MRRSQKLGFEAPVADAAGFAIGVAAVDEAGLRAAAFLAERRFAGFRAAFLADFLAAVLLVERFFAGALLAALRFEVVRFAALRLAGLRAAAFLVVRRFAGMRIPLFHAPNGAEQV